MSESDRPSQGEPIKIYPWSISATGQFSEHELIMLRGFSVEDLAEDFSAAPYAITGGFIEIVKHGNPRRAAEFLRSLVSLDQGHLKRFRDFFGDEDAVQAWLEGPLENIPGSPAEIAGPIEYIQ